MPHIWLSVIIVPFLEFSCLVGTDESFLIGGTIQLAQQYNRNEVHPFQSASASINVN